MQSIRDKVVEIEAEMRRIGYWSHAAAPELDESKLYSGVSFEAWLQFVFLRKVRAAVDSNDFSVVPTYRVGLAALRQYDYHSVVDEAHPLMSLCFALEKLLEPIMAKAQPGAQEGRAVKPRASWLGRWASQRLSYT